MNVRGLMLFSRVLSVGLDEVFHELRVLEVDGSGIVLVQGSNPSHLFVGGYEKYAVTQKGHFYSV